jgi:ribosomal protein L37AE/L43A
MLEARTRETADHERRTYECEHCKVENVITQPTGAWAYVDLSSA